ncbi:MAG: multidrug transporter substrate-binding protein [Deltaproteobacteria bacterium]|nr:multidrug transporter substrate-binding protein [Deltaproteobacteria bacterium]
MTVIWNAVRETVRHLVRNPMRSMLTMLGILIGVAAVIAMIALGRGAAARVGADLSGLGQNLLFVVPGTPGHGGPGVRGMAPPFDDADARAIRREIQGVAGVAPTTVRGLVAVQAGASWRTSITGSTADYLQVMSWQVASGRAFTDAEQRTGAAVCLLGQTVRRELFGGADPIGATIRVGNVSLRVIGTLAPKGSSSFGQDQDDFALVPLTTHQRRISGTNDVDMIFVSARDGATSDRVKRDIEDLMRIRRRLHQGETPDFTVRDMKEISAMVGSVTGLLTQLLAAIAAVSLVVGGIGIMNIMLVAVSERTREIGIRLAIGARGRDVLAQFLVEAVLLSALGGVIGIALGLAGSYAVTSRLKIPLELDVVLIALPFGFSAAVGVIFGFFPARKAARLNPIDALRHE